MSATADQLAQITSALVQLHAKFYGRGPTNAKSYAVNDTILCMLKGGFTEVEETLLRAGRERDVEAIRRSFQETMRELFIAAVEGAVNRKVEGYMSQISTRPQVAIEIFLLEPGERLLGEHELDLRRQEAARKLDAGLAEGAAM